MSEAARPKQTEEMILNILCLDVFRYELVNDYLRSSPTFIPTVTGARALYLYKRLHELYGINGILITLIVLFSSVNIFYVTSGHFL